MKLEFEWNIEKSRINEKKHGITFEEAISVFDDETAAFLHDSEHSFNEDRYLLIGYSKYNNLLFVSFTERDDRIRIISSRKATKNERKGYEENFKK